MLHKDHQYDPHLPVTVLGYCYCWLIHSKGHITEGLGLRWACVVTSQSKVSYGCVAVGVDAATNFSPINQKFQVDFPKF